MYWRLSQVCRYIRRGRGEEVWFSPFCQESLVARQAWILDRPALPLDFGTVVAPNSTGFSPFPTSMDTGVDYQISSTAICNPDLYTPCSDRHQFWAKEGGVHIIWAASRVGWMCCWLVGDEIYANIQQFIDSDTCCNYQFNINYRRAVHRALREHISYLDRDEF